MWVNGAQTYTLSICLHLHCSRLVYKHGVTLVTTNKAADMLAFRTGANHSAITAHCCVVFQQVVIKVVALCHVDCHCFVLLFIVIARIEHFVKEIVLLT